MFAGHVGAALAIARVQPRINLGAWVFAALLLDVVLWLFVLVGWETVVIPADFGRTHQPAFAFPYSHGLLAAVAWSALAGSVAYFGHSRPRAAGLRTAAFVAMAVLSHWLLDALVHAPELPLVGARSMTVGLGLWNRMPVALAVETLIAVGGLWLFIDGARVARGRKLGLTVLVLAVLAFTVLGMTVAPPPPSIAAMASSSLATIVVVCALAGWLGKRTRA
jgi:hypothetical protein